MGLRDLRMAADSWSPPSISDDGHWTTGGGAYGMGGVSVTEELALSNPVVFDCVNILMDAVGQTPALLYERTGPTGDERQRVSGSLAYRLREQPNDDQTAIEFKREMQQAASLYPHAYAEIEWRGSEPVNIWPRHPMRVRVERTDQGKRYGYLDPETSTWRPILPSNMLRIPGRPVLRHAGQTLSQALMLQRYSTRLFGRGVRASMLISTSPEEVWTQQAKDKLRDEIRAEAGGPENAGGILILDQRLKPTPMGMTNQEAELSALLTGLVGDLARWWRIPPYMIGLLESGTVSYASVNTQGVDFVVYCLGPWLAGWEQAMQRDLIVRKDSQFVEFLTASLLRGTTKERYEVYQIALSTVDPITGQPIMRVDEVRRLENLNPHGDGYRAERVAAPIPHAALGEPAARLLHAYAADNAGRVLRRETAALARIAERVGVDPRAWENAARAFYASHGAFVAEALKLPRHVAEDYAAGHLAAVLADGPSAATRWNGAETHQLVELALNEGPREVAAA